MDDIDLFFELQTSVNQLAKSVLPVPFVSRSIIQLEMVKYKRLLQKADFHLQKT